MFLRVRHRTQNDGPWTRYCNWRSDACILCLPDSWIPMFQAEYDALMFWQQDDFLNLSLPPVQAAFNKFQKVALDKAREYVRMDV